MYAHRLLAVRTRGAGASRNGKFGPNPYQWVSSKQKTAAALLEARPRCLFVIRSKLPRAASTCSRLWLP